MNRRQYLTTVSVGGICGLAGCMEATDRVPEDEREVASLEIQQGSPPYVKQEQFEAEEGVILSAWNSTAIGTEQIYDPKNGDALVTSSFLGDEHTEWGEVWRRSPSTGYIVPERRRFTLISTTLGNVTKAHVIEPYDGVFEPLAETTKDRYGFDTPVVSLEEEISAAVKTLEDDLYSVERLSDQNATELLRAHKFLETKINSVELSGSESNAHLEQINKIRYRALKYVCNEYVSSWIEDSEERLIESVASVIVSFVELKTGISVDAAQSQLEDSLADSYGDIVNIGIVDSDSQTEDHNRWLVELEAHGEISPSIVDGDISFNIPVFTELSVPSESPPTARVLHGTRSGQGQAPPIEITNINPDIEASSVNVL